MLLMSPIYQNNDVNFLKISIFDFFSHLWVKHSLFPKYFKKTICQFPAFIATVINFLKRNEWILNKNRTEKKTNLRNTKAGKSIEINAVFVRSNTMNAKSTIIAIIKKNILA